ncbi:hypothetical protein EI94DRAFT_161052 [Lactarius quietus]|nr:hypothetical protein EI94DRAFT_161052 [Lactarius quietus]
MLHVLPTELTLHVLSHLPLPSLLSLPVLSRQWFDLFAANESEIFHHAAILHEYIKPETILLEDALAVNTGKPWAGSTSWKDFCRRSTQLRKNWEGKGRAVVREVLPPGSNAEHIKIDEKAGICIAIGCEVESLTVVHLFSATSLWCLPKWYVYRSRHFKYDNGYLVFCNQNGEMEVWRLASDFSTEDEVAADAPPNVMQNEASAEAAEVYHQYAPLGQFRPWALLQFADFIGAGRLVYPTLICATHEQTFLYDVRTGSLMQTITIHFRTLGCVDVSEHHVFVCERDVVHVFSRESGIEVLRIPADATVRCSQHVDDPFLVSGDWLITPISVSPKVEESPRSKLIPNIRSDFIVTTRIAHVSRDGRDLVILSEKGRVVFIQDFERICRGETTFERAVLVIGLRLGPEDVCYGLGVEHGRVCVATVDGFYIFTVGRDLSAKAVFVRPSNDPLASRASFRGCMQLTDRRIYFTWEDSRRRQDIPLFDDVENAQELPPSTAFIGDLLTFEEPAVMGLMIARHSPFDSNSVCCIDFTLMPEDISES